MPSISVIIPVYKVEPYLRQCLDSVLAQTFSDYELILIDDGSPDSCSAICDEYAARDARIRVIHQKNSGQGKARNVGMDRAVGKYLIFLDSDDYWLPSTLETLYAEAERNQTQVLMFGATLFWDGLEEPKKNRTYKHTVQIGLVKSGPESLKTVFDAGEYHAEPWGRFYLLDYVRKTGLRFHEGIIHEDVSFSFLSHLFAERAECIGAQLYFYRKRPGSIMTSSSIQNSAHGLSAELHCLLDVYDSHSRSSQEEALLARYCVVLIKIICNLYEKAQTQKEWRMARCVQQEVGPTLKRARALSSLPRPLRLATYSLFLNWFVSKAKRTIRF